jgi:Family of unknown function (DUF5681)
MAKIGRTRNLKQWKAGQSGNPSGRPKGSRNRSTIVRQWLEATATDGDGQVVDQLVRALIKKALQQDVLAFRELMDSCYGKTTESVENTHTFTQMGTVTINGSPLKFDIGSKVASATRDA